LGEVAMENEWDQEAIQRYIDNETEEGMTLDYKAADALAKSRGKKKEIAKDVSAMANTAGGIIVYGIKEYQEKEKKHLPQAIDPIDRTQFSKEWLDQVITHNIYPRIEGLTIHPVSINTAQNHVVYVVEIPQSTTAHQVTADEDYRYYERANFETVRMPDYRIRDVMNRTTTPDVRAEFSAKTISSSSEHFLNKLEVIISNQGPNVVNHFKLEFTFPDFGSIYSPWGGSLSSNVRPGPVGKVEFDIRDAVAVSVKKDQKAYRVIYRSRGVLFPKENSDIGADINLSYYYNPVVFRSEDPSLDWILYADNMLPRQGKISFQELDYFH
jgi:hypothetical protein